MCSHPQGIPRIVLASSFVPSVSRQNSLILSQFPHIIQETILIRSHTAGHSQRGNPIYGPAVYVPSPLTVPAIRVLTPPKWQFRAIHSSFGPKSIRETLILLLRFPVLYEYKCLWRYYFKVVQSWAKAPTLMPTDCSVLRTLSILPNIRISRD